MRHRLELPLSFPSLSNSPLGLFLSTPIFTHSVSIDITVAVFCRWLLYRRSSS